MAVMPAPILRDTSPAKDAYRGLAMTQMNILKSYMEKARLHTHSRIVKLANGVVITCKKSFSREDVFVTVPPVAPAYTEVVTSIVMHGIVSHARSGDITNVGYGWAIPAASVVGGWADAAESAILTPITQSSIYPITDDDRATFNLENIKDVPVFSHRGGTDNYGNFYLVHPDDKENIISWKGCPSRQVATNQLFFTIPGAESTDESTSFTPWIYKNGAKWLRAPKCNEYSNALTGYTNEYGLILGCGWDGSTLLAVVAYTLRGTLLPGGALDLSKPFGHYVSLWAYTGQWRELGRIKWTLHPYNTLPWSFNTTGTEAVCTNGDSFTIIKNDSDPSVGTTYRVMFTEQQQSPNFDGDEIHLAESVSTSTGDGNETETTVQHTRSWEFKNQEEDKFYGFHRDEKLHLNIKVNKFVVDDVEQKKFWKEPIEITTRTICTYTVQKGPIVIICSNPDCDSAEVKITIGSKSPECMPPTCSGETNQPKSYPYEYTKTCVSTTNPPPPPVDATDYTRDDPTALTPSEYAEMSTGMGELPDQVNQSVVTTGSYEANMYGYWRCAGLDYRYNESNGCVGWFFVRDNIASCLAGGDYSFPGSITYTDCSSGSRKRTFPSPSCLTVTDKWMCL